MSLMDSPWKDGHAEGYYNQHKVLETEKCPVCSGCGESLSVHRFGHGYSHQRCHSCGGSGLKKDIPESKLRFMDWCLHSDYEREIEASGKTESYPFKSWWEDVLQAYITYGEFLTYVDMVETVELGKPIWDWQLEQFRKIELKLEKHGIFHKLNERIRLILGRQGRITPVFIQRS